MDENESIKQHAKDYLAEFSSTQDNWLKFLTHEVIEADGIVSSKNLDLAYKFFVGEASLITKDVLVKYQDKSRNLIISKLTHHSGVNALKKNEEIKFCKDITILYGLNGAGKSSYFRILNEIVGGSKTKLIYPNFYENTNESVNVEINFTIDNNSNLIKWEGDTRSVDPLDHCKVFDSYYMESFLSDRKLAPNIIEPFGLDLFAKLVVYTNNIQSKLKEDSQRLQNSRPIISIGDFSEKLKATFNDSNILPEDKVWIESLYDFSEEKESILNKKINEIDTLVKENTSDTITLREHELSKLTSIKSDLELIKVNLQSYNGKAIELLNNYDQLLQDNIAAKEKYNVLQDIPKNDSELWKNFIKAGDLYEQSLSNAEKSDDICIYCWQDLTTENAIKTVQNYALYLQDTSEVKLDEVKRELNDLRDNLNNMRIDFALEKQEKAFFEKMKIYNSTSQRYVDFNTIRASLVKKIEEKVSSTEITVPEFIPILFYYDLLISRITEEKISLQQSKSEKLKRIQALQSECISLNENKAVANQSAEIKRWLASTARSAELNKLSDSISTIKSRITRVSKEAHNGLITESLVISFKKELSELGYPNLKIRLEQKRGDSGSSINTLTLYKKGDERFSKEIQLILSEGEQKAVALALFIAELNMQAGNYPVILDDPVNSLDHRIAAKFAERLMKLNNQIIIFNHHKLFLDTFETSRNNHICKNYTGGCSQERGKHIQIFKVESRGESKKGVVNLYIRQSAKALIAEAKRQLERNNYNGISDNIRLAVEDIVDNSILQGIVPCKFSNANSRINWNALTTIKISEDTVNALRRIYARVSGGHLHKGTERDENPIEHDEYQALLDEMDLIIRGDSV